MTVPSRQADEALDRLESAISQFGHNCPGPCPRCTDEAALATVRSELGRLREAGQEVVRDADTAWDEVRRLRSELERLREQVKFCPYCAGAFVPESAGYEGPCEGCKRARRLEDGLREHIAAMEKAEANWEETAKRERTDASVAYMCGEGPMPAHPISVARAMSFGSAAESARALLAGADERQDG